MVSQAKRIFNINIARELTIYPSSDKLSAHVEINGFAIYCLQPQPGKHRLWFDAQIGSVTLPQKILGSIVDDRSADMMTSTGTHYDSFNRFSSQCVHWNKLCVET